MKVKIHPQTRWVRRCLKTGAGTLLFFPLLLSHPALAAEDLTAENLDLNDVKAVKTYYRELPDSLVGQVMAVAVIDAPLEIVWETIVDYNNLGRGSRTLRLRKVERLENELTRVSLGLDMPWPLRDLTCTLEFSEDKEKREMRWRNIAGFVRQNQGWITLQEVGARTLMKFVVSIDLGTFLPQRIVNWAMQQKLPDEINLIRKSVELRRSGFTRKGAG